ncbi:hypothetical protein, partial [Bradyrhizobium sacchari]
PRLEPAGWRTFLAWSERVTISPLNSLLPIFFKRHLMATWKRRYSTVPIAKWQQKANLIGKETNRLSAAAARDDLNQMDYLDDAIIEALSDFDGWVQQQIDRARGK